MINLYKIGTLQRRTLIFFLSTLVLALCNSYYSATHPDSLLATLLAFIVIGVSIAYLIAAGRLAYALHSKGAAIAFCIGLLIPLVNLFVLITLMSQAKKHLKAAGVKVGLMGANKTDLAALAP
jgi:hypothetical protein